MARSSGVGEIERSMHRRSPALFPLLFLLACTPEGPAPVTPPKAPGPATTAEPLIAGNCEAVEIPDAGEDNRYEDERGAKEKPDKPGDLCANADSNLKRSMDAILAAQHPAPAGAATSPR